MTTARSRLVEILLVLCALASTAAVLHRRFAGSSATGAPAAKVHDPDSLYTTGRIHGRRDAPVRLAVWTDYQCPACAQYDVGLGQVEEALGDSLVVVFHHLPNPIAHPLALEAAVMAECSSRRGRFTEMHAALFGAGLATRESIPRDSILRLAGLADDAGYLACAADTAVAERIRNEAAQAIALGIRGTPASLFGDSIVVGALPPDRLLAYWRAGR